MGLVPSRIGPASGRCEVSSCCAPLSRLAAAEAWPQVGWVLAAAHRYRDSIADVAGRETCAHLAAEAWLRRNAPSEAGVWILRATAVPKVPRWSEAGRLDS